MNIITHSAWTDDHITMTLGRCLRWFVHLNPSSLTCEQISEPEREGAAGPPPGTKPERRPSTGVPSWSSTHTAPRGPESRKQKQRQRDCQGKEKQDINVVILFFPPPSLSLSHTHTHTHSELLVREVAQGHPSTQLWCPLCRAAGKVSPRVFLPHRSDPPYAHPNHGYTAASLSLSLTHQYMHVYGCTSTRAHTKTSSVSSTMCSFLQAAPCFCLLSASAQLNLLNLIFCLLLSLLPPHHPPTLSLLSILSMLFSLPGHSSREGGSWPSQRRKRLVFRRVRPPLKTHIQPRTHVDIPAAYLNDYYFFQGLNLLLEL